ncbi:8426_t:CDS:1, partial [Cetraspora pellucida]
LRMIMWELTSGYRPFYDRPYNTHLVLDTPQCSTILMQKCWHSNPLK